MPAKKRKSLYFLFWRTHFPPVFSKSLFAFRLFDDLAPWPIIEIMVFYWFSVARRPEKRRKPENGAWWTHGKTGLYKKDFMNFTKKFKIFLMEVFPRWKLMSVFRPFRKTTLIFIPRFTSIFPVNGQGPTPWPNMGKWGLIVVPLPCWLLMKSKWIYLAKIINSLSFL